VAPGGIPWYYDGTAGAMLNPALFSRLSRRVHTDRWKQWIYAIVRQKFSIATTEHHSACNRVSTDLKLARSAASFNRHSKGKERAGILRAIQKLIKSA